MPCIWTGSCSSVLERAPGRGAGEGADRAGGSGGGAARPPLLVQVWFSMVAAMKTIL
jgi:hypothetical protein